MAWLYGHPTVTGSAVGLSIIAWRSIATTGPMCARALEAPGITAPLQELYAYLSLVQ